MQKRLFFRHRFPFGRDKLTLIFQILDSRSLGDKFRGNDNFIHGQDARATTGLSLRSSKAGRIEDEL